jgi:hypothetical protein
MNTQDFGPFATIVAVALALVATFAYLAPRMVGRIQDWTWLADNPPTFLTMVPARIIAVVVMAVAYVTINDDTYWIFVALAAIAGILGTLNVFRFDHLRRLHIAEIEQVGPDGQSLRDKHGKTVVKRVIIGSEEQLRSQAAKDLKAARKKRGGVSLLNFMAGYGNPVNNPSNLWDNSILAKIGSQLTRTLTAVVLFAVLALYLASLIVVSGPPA